MQVTIIVPVFNQWHLLPEFIELISSQCESILTSSNLIIVDNGSDWLPSLPESHNVNIIVCKKPGSYAARNFGIQHAKGELLVFTDADCLPDIHWLANIIEAYKRSDKKTLLAGNVVVRSKNHKRTTAELYDIALGLPQERYVFQGFAVTANLAIPRAVFNEVGFFDDSRFSGGDADFCQRALRAGFSLKYVPDAIVYHPARESWSEYATKVKRTKGGQIRAGKQARRIKYFFVTLLPPVWRFWRTLRSDKLKLSEKTRVIWFQFRLWCVELAEMFALICGKTPERR